MPKRSSSSSKSSVLAYVTIQTLVGLLFFAIWAFVSIQVAGDTAIQVLTSTAPLFGCYLLGILSRHVPGISEMAKRLKSASR